MRIACPMREGFPKPSCATACRQRLRQYAKAPWKPDSWSRGRRLLASDGPESNVFTVILARRLSRWPNRASRNRAAEVNCQTRWQTLWASSRTLSEPRTGLHLTDRSPCAPRRPSALSTKQQPPAQTQCRPAQDRRRSDPESHNWRVRAKRPLRGAILRGRYCPRPAPEFPGIFPSVIASFLLKSAALGNFSADFGTLVLVYEHANDFMRLGRPF